jgi:hypothetical protein
VNGYSNQKGSSTGLTIGLHQVFGKVADIVKGGAHSEKKRVEFEKARRLQGELASAMQWDLYNRTKAPDVSVFHKHNSKAGGTFDKVVAGQQPVFSGLSMSQHYRKGWWADGCFSTPMAIRHVVMATISGNVTGGYEHEQEVAVADPFAAKPGKAMNWSDSSFAPGKAKWLESQTHQAASGEISRCCTRRTRLELRAADPAVAARDSDGLAGGGKAWKEPPADAQVLPGKWGTKKNATARRSRT